MSENIVEQATSYVNPEELLAYTIVSTVRKDYETALKKGDKATIEECEEFFRSDRCAKFLILTDLTGEFIMDEVKRLIKEGNR